MLTPQPSAPPAEQALPAEVSMEPSTPAVEEVPAETEATGITPEEIEAHFDAMSDEDKTFIAEHLTPEFVRAIGLVSGPEVATYLDQFADKDKVLVPVPRQVAEEYLAKQGTAAQQNGPSPAPAQPQGMMAPRPPASNSGPRL